MNLMVNNNLRKVENELQDINIYWWINFMPKFWWGNPQTFCLFIFWYNNQSKSNLILNMVPCGGVEYN